MKGEYYSITTPKLKYSIFENPGIFTPNLHLCTDEFHHGVNSGYFYPKITLMQRDEFHHGVKPVSIYPINTPMVRMV